VRAADGPLPIYAEGLRLLNEGLRMLPPDVGQPRITQLDQRVGRSLWSSPFTAGVSDLSGPSSPRSHLEFDVSVAPRA
jgi:hypothetical protein